MKIVNLQNKIKEISLSEVKDIKTSNDEKLILVRKIYDKGMGSYMNLNPFAETHMRIFNAWFPVSRYTVKYKIKNTNISLISVSNEICDNKNLTDIREYVDVVLDYLKENCNKVFSPIC